MVVAGPAGAAARWLLQALPGLAGLVLVSVGAWMAWPPAGFISAGVLLLVDRAWEQVRTSRRDVPR